MEVKTYHKHRHEQQEAYHLGKYQEVGRVDTHYIEGVDLLGDTHGAYLGRDVGAHLTCQDEA